MATPRMITAAGTTWPERYTFSPALQVGNLLFLAGTTAVDEQGTLVAPGDIVGQTRFILEKFGKLLNAAGADFSHVVETTEYITTTDNYRGTAAVRREFFRPPYPVATGVIVAGLLREGALIEISAVAVLPEMSRGSGSGTMNSPR
jgi:enamine deaminase RidA (YjgF/YER057c/UK114 family)